MLFPGSQDVLSSINSVVQANFLQVDLFVCTRYVACLSWKRVLSWTSVSPGTIGHVREYGRTPTQHRSPPLINSTVSSSLQYRLSYPHQLLRSFTVAPSEGSHASAVDAALRGLHARAAERARVLRRARPLCNESGGRGESRVRARGQGTKRFHDGCTKEWWNWANLNLAGFDRPQHHH